MQTGLHGDPRTTNPNPGEPSLPPFLGVTNWPLVTSAMSVVLTVAFFGYLAWRSVRDRSPHWLLIVGIAALFAGALDPLANWATFAVFDPRVAHFPLSWPYFNISPLLEPTLSFLGGYASYYVLTGLGLLVAASAIHRATNPPQQLARPASVRRRVHHRIHCGPADQRADAVHVAESRSVRLHRGGGPGAGTLEIDISRCTW